MRTWRSLALAAIGGVALLFQSMAWQQEGVYPLPEKAGPLRKAMLLNGVDLMRSGGFTSIAHGDGELSHTINAFDQSLEQIDAGDPLFQSVSEQSRCPDHRHTVRSDNIGFEQCALQSGVPGRGDYLGSIHYSGVVRPLFAYQPIYERECFILGEISYVDVTNIRNVARSVLTPLHSSPSPSMLISSRITSLMK